MGPQDFHELMTAKPFQPFRLRLTNGDSIEVLRKRTGMAMSTMILVSYDYIDGDEPHRTRFVPYPEVVGVEMLDPALERGW